jgi:hypothetical protein
MEAEVEASNDGPFPEENLELLLFVDFIAHQVVATLDK